MTYNKSEIMSKAWRIYKSNSTRSFYKIATFADALRRSWAEAKEKVATYKAISSANTATKKIGRVSPRELNTGDTIRIRQMGSTLNKVIVSIKPASLGFNGVTLGFKDNSIAVIESYMPVERVAVAA